MFARLTSISVPSSKMEELRRIFNEEIVPVVKAQRGNLGIWLLEPTNENDDYISLTEWLSAADADAYEASGIYRQLVDKIKDMYNRKPVLKTYNIADTKVAVTM